jgi:hypothetical protein
MTGRAANLLPIILVLVTLSACTPKAKMQLPPDPAALEEPVKTKVETTRREALPAPQKSGKIDVDLTKMNANMIYSYIFEMIINPDEYVGKTIKVNGFFYSVVDENTGERYFAVIIPDALACCKQGMEFKWLGEHTYPADYPEENQEITITGTYRTDIMEGDISYSYLEVSELSILK